jgi:hypothetical protein
LRSSSKRFSYLFGANNYRRWQLKDPCLVQHRFVFTDLPSILTLSLHDTCLLTVFLCDLGIRLLDSNLKNVTLLVEVAAIFHHGVELYGIIASLRLHLDSVDLN